MGLSTWSGRFLVRKGQKERGRAKRKEESKERGGEGRGERGEATLMTG